nr:hypothetical protein [uncultured Acetatifactor sp.]
MSGKIKLELREYHFGRRLVIQLLLLFVICCAQRQSLHALFPEASLGEFLIFVLDNENIVLALLPVMLLAFTSSRRREVCRYPLLIRYRNRNEFFLVKIISRMLFAGLLLLSLIGLLLLVGLWTDMPLITRHAFLEGEQFDKIIALQTANLFCFFCFMLMLHEILRSILHRSLLDLVLTAFLPVVNLVVIKLHLSGVMLWTPWGNIAYMLEGQERTNYQFYWWYWLLVVLAALYAADLLHGRKDYVFEENRKIS